MVRVGLVPLRCCADVALNLEKTITGVREAAAKGALVETFE